MSTRPGACVARARLAAALGSPIPTKQVMPSRRARAAQAVIISSAVNSPAVVAAGLMRLSFLARSGTGQPRRVGGAEHIRLQPAEEPLPVSADRIPGHVVVVFP